MVVVMFVIMSMVVLGWLDLLIFFRGLTLKVRFRGFGLFWFIMRMSM
jgi:hypothetical protein